MKAENIAIIEGTTKYINIDVLNTDKSRMNLSGFKAYISILYDNVLIKRRECEIKNDVVHVVINPKDTVGKANTSMQYEVRIIDDETNTVLAIKYGEIVVKKSIDPIIKEGVKLIDINK